MINYTINYIVYTAGHRHHHAGTQTQLSPQQTGVASSPGSIPVFAFGSLPYMGKDLPFAFMSVVGAQDGNYIYPTPGNYAVPVGTTDIRILLVYAPVGNGGQPGVWVDAFDVDTGNFSDSDFIQIYTNGTLDNPATATANNDGFVSSNSAEDLRSYTSVDGLPFQEWDKIGGSVTNTIDYNLQQKEIGLAFAFYHSFTIVVPKPSAESVWIYLSPGVFVDAGGWGLRPGGGPPVPIGPWGPLVAKLMSTLAILSVSENMSKPIRAKAISLAVEHLNSVTATIKVMGEEK